MALPKLTAVTRTQGNNRALKDGTVKPKTFEFAFEEVDPLIVAFRRMVRGNEFDITEMAITTYICAREHGKRMTAVRPSRAMLVDGALTVTLTSRACPKVLALSWRTAAREKLFAR